MPYAQPQGGFLAGLGRNDDRNGPSLLSRLSRGRSKSKSALDGELGLFKNEDGTHSSERSITITDDRINDGKPTNIPQLVRGQNQKAIDRILANKTSRADVEVAIMRAMQRVGEGGDLPFYKTIDEAVKNAGKRSSGGGATGGNMWGVMKR